MVIIKPDWSFICENPISIDFLGTALLLRVRVAFQLSVQHSQAKRDAYISGMSVGFSSTLLPHMVIIMKIIRL